MAEAHEIFVGTVAVAHVMSRSRVVINKGTADGVKLGTSFLFVAEGPEISDPITGKSLGILEMVRGHGKVIYCQENMAQVESTMRREIKKSKSPLMALTIAMPFEPTEYEDLPFDGIEVGDVGRPV